MGLAGHWLVRVTGEPFSLFCFSLCSFRVWIYVRDVTPFDGWMDGKREGKGMGCIETGKSDVLFFAGFRLSGQFMSGGSCV